MGDGPAQYVRPGVAADAAQMGVWQGASWRETLRRADAGTDWSAAVPDGTLAGAWESALAQPPSPRRGILVAEENGTPVGFVAYAPGVADPSPLGDHPVEILALEVAPEAQRRGHASRLLAAVVDTVRPDDATSLYVWEVPSAQARLRFWQALGFGPAGRRRELELPDGRLDQHLWHAAL